jgi:hypothetical protein
MPEPIHHDQDDNTASEAILGVDAHKDLHAAAVINPLGVVLSSEMSRPPKPVTRSCLPGRVGSARCGGPGWSAPAPTGPH